jgi:hypothetical protein
MTIGVEANVPSTTTPRIARVAISAARLLLGVMLFIMVALNVINAVLPLRLQHRVSGCR